MSLKRFDLGVIVAAIAIVAGGAGFAVGHYTVAKAPTANQNSAGQNNGTGGQGGFGAGTGGGFGRRGGFGVRGTVSAVSGSTITVAGTNGTTYTVDVSSTTTYMNGFGGSATCASLSDVTTGSTILAAGQTSGTTVTATRIILNPPTFNGGPGGPNGGSSSSGSSSGAGGV